MNSALLLILTGPNCWNHVTAITTRNTQNKIQNFLPHRLEDMRAPILVKNTKKWVFTTMFSMNINKKNLHSGKQLYWGTEIL